MSGGIYTTDKSKTLQSLADVVMDNLQNNQAPVYDSTLEIFTNQTVLTPSDLPSGSLGDVIISDGVNGLQGTSRLNVNPSNGDITGTLIRADTNNLDIAIGLQGGNNSGGSTIAIGFDSGNNTGEGAIAIGYEAGQNGQGEFSIAIGPETARDSQGEFCVAIGGEAGQNSQNDQAIAIGNSAGRNSQGQSAIAIGYEAATTNQGNNSIVINATGSALENTNANSCKIAPIRTSTGTSQPLTYDDTTKELFQQTTLTINEASSRVGIGTTTPAVRLDVGTGSIRGATEIVNQSTGAISATNCYGDTIYADTSGGTLTLPAGVVGMNLQTINASGGTITVAVQTGEYLDDTLNGTDNLSTSGSKPHVHKFVCGATGKWYILH